MLKIIQYVILTADKKTTDININMINELVYDAHDHRQGYVLFVINIAEKAVHISDDDKNKAIEPEGARIEKVKQQSCRKTVDHPGQVAVYKSYGKGKNKQQIR